MVALASSACGGPEFDEGSTTDSAAVASGDDALLACDEVLNADLQLDNPDYLYQVKTLRGACGGNLPPPPNPKLTTVIQGTGRGTVVSSPAGIHCGTKWSKWLPCWDGFALGPTDCSKDYLFRTTVTLTAIPEKETTFAGWSGGGCSGTGPCVVSLTSDTTVTALFTRNPRGACRFFACSTSADCPAGAYCEALPGGGGYCRSL
jgi:hypothetical protein